MYIELHIDGLFEMSVFYLDGKEVGQHKDKDILKGILDNLQQGEYVIGFNSKNIHDINDLENPIYTFELGTTDNMDYMFDCAVASSH